MAAIHRCRLARFKHLDKVLGVQAGIKQLRTVHANHILDSQDGFVGIGHRIVQVRVAHRRQEAVHLGEVGEGEEDIRIGHLDRLDSIFAARRVVLERHEYHLLHVVHQQFLSGRARFNGEQLSLPQYLQNQIDLA